MRNRKDISLMKSRVVVRQWNVAQDAGAGSYTTQRQAWNRWAYKENRSGSQNNDQAQQQWVYTTRFIMRYDARFKSNFTIDHEGERYVINSIQRDEEAYRGQMICDCTYLDVYIDVS